MTKRRLYKMTPLQRDILAKVLVETQKEFPPKQAEKMQVLRERTKEAHKCRLYLDDEELDYAVRAVNSVRSGFLAAGKATGGFDRVLFGLLNSKYRRVPAPYR